MLHTFSPNISHAYLFNVEPSNLVPLKTYSTEFDEIIMIHYKQTKLISHSLLRNRNHMLFKLSNVSLFYGTKNKKIGQRIWIFVIRDKWHTGKVGPGMQHAYRWDARNQDLGPQNVYVGPRTWDPQSETDSVPQNILVGPGTRDPKIFKRGQGSGTPKTRPGTQDPKNEWELYKSNHYNLL